MGRLTFAEFRRRRGNCSRWTRHAGCWFEPRCRSCRSMHQRMHSYWSDWECCEPVGYRRGSLRRPGSCPSCSRFRPKAVERGLPLLRRDSCCCPSCSRFRPKVVERGLRCLHRDSCCWSVGYLVEFDPRGHLFAASPSSPRELCHHIGSLWPDSSKEFHHDAADCAARSCRPRGGCHC